MCGLSVPHSRRILFCDENVDLDGLPLRDVCDNHDSKGTLECIRHKDYRRFSNLDDRGEATELNRITRRHTKLAIHHEGAKPLSSVPDSAGSGYSLSHAGSELALTQQAI